MSGRHRAPSAARLTAARTWWWPYLVIAVLAALLVTTTGAHGGYTAAITNTGDQTRTGSLITSAVSGGTTECDLGTAAYNPITTNSAICSGDLTPVLPTGTGTAALATTVTDRGSLSATSASLTTGTCGPIQLANSVTASDPLLVRGSTLTYAQTGPLSGSTGLGLGGTSSYAADVTQATPPANNFTEAIWFKTTAGLATGGVLIGTANTPSNYLPSNADRMLWVDNTGHVVFGIHYITYTEVTSSAKYNDGAWHLAVVSVSSTAGESLTVDSATITNTATAARTAGTTSSYWHVGWGYVTTGWTDAPSSAYLTGTLADAAVFPAVLTTAQTATLYASSSQTAWASTVSGLSATYSWTLGDDGNTAYTGTVPSVTPAGCAFIDVTVGATTTSTACAYPTGAGACAAPSTSSRLSALASSTKSFGVFPTTTQSMAVTVTIQRDATNTVTANQYAGGLNITTPLTISCVAAGNFSATLVWAGQQDMVL